MELREYLIILRKRWTTVAVLALTVTAIVLSATLLTTPLYQATTRVFFAVQAGESVSDLAQGSSFTERQMGSYAQVARSPLVLAPVIEELGLDATPSSLAQSVSASSPPNTVILEITSTSEDPDEAALVANAVADQLSSTVADLSPDRPDGTQAVLATTLTPAEVPDSPASPNPKRNLALGLVLGVMVGVGLAILREALDTKIRTERDLVAVTDRPLLGSIVFDPGAPSHPLAMHDDPHGRRAESVRRLRTNLQFVDAADAPQSIVVTSAIPGEGKSTTAINLAVALADAGTRVLLIDADLRRPTAADVLGLEGAVGLTTVLIGRASPEQAVQTWNRTTLDVLTAGAIPPNPSELLGSPAMTGLLERLTQSYEVVLLDSAPLLPVTDTAVLSRIAGGTLVVVGTDRIHRDQLRSALETLEAVNAHVLGLVLNKVAPREANLYGYGYNYSADRELPPPSAPKQAPGTDTRVDTPATQALPGSEAPLGTWPGEPIGRRAR